jgi:hypothetical protein
MSTRFRVVVALLVSLPTLWPSALAQDAPKVKYSQIFHHDFRGKPLPDELTLFGQNVETFITQEPEGLRIKLPKARDNYQPVGMRTTFSLRGDFEITVAVEILHAEVPKVKESFGVGATLYVNRAATPTEGSTLGRLMRTGGRETVVWDRSPGQNSKFEGSDRPCLAKTVRLRMKRTGNQWHYLWAPGAAGDNFEEVNQWQFGDEEIKQVTLRCATGGQPCAVEVRYIDLLIKSGGTTPEAANNAVNQPPAQPVNPIADGSAKATKASWLMAAGLIAGIFVLIVAIVMVAWLIFMQRRASAQATPEPAPVHERPKK